MATKTKKKTMQDLLDEVGEEIKVLEVGDVVEGSIVAVTKNGVWLDLGGYGTGLVVGIEVSDPSFREKLNIGDKLSASVIEQEFDHGEVLLSLKKATREKSWDMLKRVKDESEFITVRPFEANKGGLMIEVDGVKGFLPVSQLSAEHYPRVTDKDEILVKLNQLVNKHLSVGVLDVDRRESKVIFSEKIAKRNEVEEKMKAFKVGSKINGKVTGLADFGIFLNIDGIEGLVHISEIAWDKVEDPSQYVKIGDEIDVQIIGVEADRLSLSIKKLKDDPWAKAVEKFKVGDKVKGEVTRYTPFGAFVKINDNVEALVHISELSTEHVKDPSEVVQIGKKYDFKILTIDKENHRLALSLKQLEGKGGTKEQKDPTSLKLRGTSKKTEKKEDDKKKEVKKKATKKKATSGKAKKSHPTDDQPSSVETSTDKPKAKKKAEKNDKK